MNKKPTIMLLDGDVLVYKVGFAAEVNTNWGNGLHTWHAKVDEAAPAMGKIIEELRDNLRADKIVVALTCHETVNFRKQFWPAYKENRRNVRKPLLWKALREYLVKKYDTRVKDFIEADDILGILSTMPNTGQNRIIASIDKDFKSIPGQYYNIKDKTLETITEEVADYNFFKQCLTGDAVDNYPGLKGWGPVKAERHLEGVPMNQCWAAVVAAYEGAGLNEEHALAQARCARILRFTDYDHTRKGPILWTPPKA